MKRILFVGAGDIAQRTARLLQDRYRLYGLARSGERAALLRRQHILPLAGDLDAPASLQRLAGVAEWLVHLAPPPAHGERDSRTANLLRALTKRGSLPHGVVYISTSGVYGDCHGELASETREPAAHTARARRRVDAERQLRNWAQRHRLKLAILRVPGIYASDRLPLERIRNATPALRDEDDGYTNHIHADDLARAIVQALHRQAGIRIFNVVDDSRLKMGEYFDLVADAAGLARPPRIARAAADGLISPAMLSFMDESRQLDNRRMHRELRLQLRYPTVASGLAAFKPAG
ncbi:MAG: NAD-dependent epimerase/dehydratase family protein [Chitinivorax sp.]